MKDTYPYHHYFHRYSGLNSDLSRFTNNYYFHIVRDIHNSRSCVLITEAHILYDTSGPGQITCTINKIFISRSFLPSYSYIVHLILCSGMIGSGTCIFSKHSIIETFYQKYSVNGYAHKIQHGDWFGGKGVGLARILVGKLHVNVYVTHVC